MSEEFSSIPEEVLAHALNTASLPLDVGKPGPFTTDIYESVDDLKSAIRLDEPAGIHWQKLKFHLEQAAESECWDAFDDFARAWSQKLPSMDDEHCPSEFFAYGQRPIREPLTFLLILTIRQLQVNLNRAPFRDEILNAIVVRLPPNKGMDEAELSRQLKKLKWAGFIPCKGKCPYPRRPSHEKIERIKGLTAPRIPFQP